MSMLGKVRIGHKAPDFHCEAVIKGVIEGLVSTTYPKYIYFPLFQLTNLNRSVLKHLHLPLHQTRNPRPF